MKYCIDVSNFSGTPTLGALSELVNSERLERIAIGCEFADTYAAWYDLAHQLGLEIDAWLYLYDPTGWQDAIGAALAQFGTRPPRALWLDIEDTRWSIAQGDIDGALDRLDGYGIEHGIYTAPGLWAGYGNPWAGERTALWLAKWVNREPLEADFDVQFGGWERASMVQYRAEFVSYGLTVDLNAYE